MADDKKRLKMAIISGASHALRYKSENPRESDDEVLRKVARESTEILEKIDEE